MQRLRRAADLAGNRRPASPNATHVHARDPKPSAPRGLAPQARTCSLSCLSWLHPLKSWSLRQTRRGSVVTSKRDKAAALKLLKRIMKKYGRPRKIVTDGLLAVSRGDEDIGNAYPSRGLAVASTIAQRIRTSHFEQRPERAMQLFRSAKTLQSSVEFTRRSTIISTRTSSRDPRGLQTETIGRAGRVAPPLAAYSPRTRPPRHMPIPFHQTAPVVTMMVWTSPARHLAQGRAVPRWLSLKQHLEGATSVGKSIINLSSVTTVGLDLAKHVFQVHCVDASGALLLPKRSRRNRLRGVFRLAAPLPCRA